MTIHPKTNGHTADTHNQPLTECVFTASGVDAVGEVVMCVDILPQPNGEHKISVKGKTAEQSPNV